MVSRGRQYYATKKRRGSEPRASHTYKHPIIECLLASTPAHDNHAAAEAVRNGQAFIWVQSLGHELTRRVSRENAKLGENNELNRDGTNGFLIYEQNWRELAAPVRTRARIADE